MCKTIREVGGAINFAVYWTLKNVDCDGISKTELAKRCCITPATLNKCLKELRDLGIIPQHTFDTFGKKKTREFENGNDVIKAYCRTFQDTFGFPYVPNYSRDSSLCRGKLVDCFDDEKIRAILDIGVGEYSKHFSTPAYKTPTIFALCDWIANKAISIYIARRESDSLVSRREAIDIEAGAMDFLGGE